MAHPTHFYLAGFQAALEAKMAEQNPKTDAQIEAENGPDDQPEDEN